MALDRRATLSICLGSFFLMLGSGFLLWSRWEKLSHGTTPVKKVNLPETFDPAPGVGTGWPTPAVPSNPATPAAPPARPPAPAPSPDSGKTRNIRFTLRDSRPTKVELIGNFDNWTPEPMAKGDNYIWEISVPLKPGEYTYNFLVDGKPSRDPNNPRTAPEGRSLLVVKPLP